MIVLFSSFVTAQCYICGRPHNATIMSSQQMFGEFEGKQKTSGSRWIHSPITGHRYHLKLV